MYVYCIGPYKNEKIIERSLKSFGIGSIVLLLAYEVYNFEFIIGISLILTLVMYLTKDFIVKM
jgi:hypothetical protein